MRSVASSSFLTACALGFLLAAQRVRAASWTLTDTINPNDYDDAFDYFNEQDPTGGLVLYQTETDAKANNLTGVANGKYYMRVDTTEVQTEGRRSIRLSSKKSYNDGVYVLNVSHVPTGCATWPAFWTVTENLGSWPTGGEIDILENANDLYNGAMSALHTKSSCILPSAQQSGVGLSNNCSAYTTNNEACPVIMNGTSTPSWGTRFNAQGGGVVAMERSFGSTGNGVRVWYWSDSQVPDDVRNGSSTVDPSAWGTPGANFDVANNCHSQFGAHKITFDITLCGSFGAETYNLSSCNAQYPSCSFQVGQNGSSFNQSYWSLGSLRVFATGGSTDNAANSANTTPEQNATNDMIRGMQLNVIGLVIVALSGATALLL